MARPKESRSRWRDGSASAASMFAAEAIVSSGDGTREAIRYSVISWMFFSPNTMRAGSSLRRNQWCKSRRFQYSKSIGQE